MFTDEEKAIFGYNNGKANVFGDPLALQRKLNVILQGDIDAAVTSAYAEKTGDTDGSMQRLVDAVRETFGLAPFDTTTGEGMTDTCVLVVLRKFGEFLNEKKI